MPTAKQVSEYVNSEIEATEAKLALIKERRKVEPSAGILVRAEYLFGGELEALTKLKEFLAEDKK